MSLKNFAAPLNSGWRPTNTNDTDDSDCSSDSDSTVQYIHNFLSSRAKSNDITPAHNNWLYSTTKLTSSHGCEHSRPPFLPTKPPNANTITVSSAAGGNYHLMHHDYAERMNEQLTRDTFNSDTGDLLDFGVRTEVPRSTVSDIVTENIPSNSVSSPERRPYEMPVAPPLNLAKCPIKKRQWLMANDSCSSCSTETRTGEGTSKCDGPSSSRSGASDLRSPNLVQWSSYRSSLAPPLLSDLISASTVSSSVPSTEVPSSSNQRDRLKLRLKRINLSEASSSLYSPYTCTLSHPVRSGVSNTMWQKPRDKPSVFPQMTLVSSPRAQPSSTSQVDPGINDSSSPEIQFISMGQPSVLMSHVSERMKRRKRRRMHLGMLGKTYVSDEVIVVDDGHQEQDGRSPQLQCKASVPGPSSRRKLNGFAVASARPDRSTPAQNLSLPHSSSTVTERPMEPDSVGVENGNSVPIDHVEIPAERCPVDDATSLERSTTPDSVVALTPSREVVVDSPTMPADTAATGAAIATNGLEESPFPDTMQDRTARTSAASTSCSPPVPVQKIPTMLNTTLSLAFGSSGSEPAPRGLGKAEATLYTQSKVGSAPCSVGSPGSSRAVPLQSVVLDAAKAVGDAASEAMELEMTGPSQEGQPTIRVRDLPRDEAVVDCANRMKSKMMSLTAILECPVCLEYVGPPIYQCRRGHIVCGLCKPKLLYCPTCRAGFSECRNLIAEMFAEKLDYPCKNAHLGCESTFMLKDKEDHEANCAFRFYKCILCPWKGLHRELLPHLMRDHPGKVGHGAEQEILLELGDMTASANQNWIVSAMNEIFRVNFILAKRQNNMQIMGSVQFIGPKQHADDFIYTFEVRSEEFDQHCIFSRKTHSDLDKCYTYYTNGDGFFINNSVLFCSGEEGNKCILVKLVLKKRNV